MFYTHGEISENITISGIKLFDVSVSKIAKFKCQWKFFPAWYYVLVIQEHVPWSKKFSVYCTLIEGFLKI